MYKENKQSLLLFSVFKLHITTKTTAKMRLESMKRRQIKLHNRRRKKKKRGISKNNAFSKRKMDGYYYF